MHWVSVPPPNIKYQGVRSLEITTSLTGLAAGQYELQLSYTDVNAATVIASTTIADTAVATNRAIKGSDHLKSQRH